MFCKQVTRKIIVNKKFDKFEKSKDSRGVCTLYISFELFIKSKYFFFVYVFGGVQCFGNSFAYVAHFLEMFGFEPRELPYQAGALPT
jgi:hypothetical protein